MKQTNNSLEVIAIDLYKDPLTSIYICVVQRSQKLAPRLFPTLPYCKENFQFPKEVDFRYFDLNKLEYIQLCKILVEKNPVLL